MKREKKLEQALADLYDFCISGRRYHSQNPYTIPEIHNARILLKDWPVDSDSELMVIDRTRFTFRLDR